MRGRLFALLLLALPVGCARQGFRVGGGDAGPGSAADGGGLAFWDAGDGPRSGAGDRGLDGPPPFRDGAPPPDTRAPPPDTRAPADVAAGGTPVATKAHTCATPLVVDLAQLAQPVKVVIDPAGAAVISDSSCCSGLPHVILRLENAPGGAISRVCRSGTGALRTIIDAFDGAACPPPSSAGCGQSPCPNGGAAATSAPSGTVHLRACRDGEGPALLVLEK